MLPRARNRGKNRLKIEIQQGINSRYEKKILLTDFLDLYHTEKMPLKGFPDLY
jgi:flagellar basal body-associated protein FliL